MENALIVADRGAEQISELVLSQYRTQIVSATSGSQARRMLLDRHFDVVLINTPLHDETGVEFSIEAASTTRAGILLIVKAEHLDEISARVEESGVFVVEKPIHKTLFQRALRLVFASGQRLRGMEKEKIKLQNKIEEIRLVDRAKCTLIHYLKMTEPQAHRYIEKQAMDMRLTRREVAESILKTYEV